MTELRREVRIPIYWLVVGLCVMVVSPIASIWTSVQINKHTITAANATAAAAKEQASREFAVRYCRLVGAQVDVYSESETEVGKNAHQTWLEEYRLSGCLPRK